MTRFAIISDIHGNLPALEAVLADIERQGVNEIYHLGDLVGYNPFPNETVALIASRGIPGLRGNYDQAVLGQVADPVGEFLNARITPMGLEIYHWTLQEVNDQTRKFLASLPQQMTVAKEGWRFRLTHGSPRHIKDYVRPSWPDEMFLELLAEVSEEVLCTGHTHIPLIRQFDRQWLLNPGSVGFPKDGNPLASYALVAVDQELTIEIRRVEYDIERTVRAIGERGLPPKAAADLRAGRR